MTHKYCQTTTRRKLWKCMSYSGCRTSAYAFIIVRPLIEPRVCYPLRRTEIFQFNYAFNQSLLSNTRITLWNMRGLVNRYCVRNKLSVDTQTVIYCYYRVNVNFIFEKSKCECNKSVQMEQQVIKQTTSTSQTQPVAILY